MSQTVKAASDIMFLRQMNFTPECFEKDSSNHKKKFDGSVETISLVEAVLNWQSKMESEKIHSFKN